MVLFPFETLELGYTFPQQITNLAHLKNNKILLAGDNLVTSTQYKGYTWSWTNDEQNGGGSGTLTRGTDHGRFPYCKSIIVGVQVNF